MPNYCNNDLKIEYAGPLNDERFDQDEVIDTFLRECVFNGRLDSSKIFPIPENYPGDWMHKMIGCKWHVEADLDRDDLQCSFDSPWGPPDKFIENISLKYSHLRFTLEFYEPGMDFCGRITRCVYTGEKLDEDDEINSELGLEILGEDYFFEHCCEVIDEMSFPINILRKHGYKPGVFLNDFIKTLDGKAIIEIINEIWKESA